MRILLDTNVLLRLVETGHPQHPQATAAIDALRRQGHHLCLVPQNLYEFWVVATRPSDVNGLGMTPSEAQIIINDFLRLFTLLRDERAIFEQWFELVVQQSVCGVKAHDARLAAAMQRHGVDRILTFNAGDFRRFDRITVTEPGHVVATTSEKTDDADI